MRKTLLVIAVLVAIAVAVPWALTAQSPPEDVALDRVERKYGLLGWGCIDYCSGYTFEIRTPPDVTAVDVVVAATISYRLAAGHHGYATLGRVVPGPAPCCRPRTTPLRGGAWPLASTGGRRVTTTLTWFEQALPASGRAYAFDLGFGPGSPHGGFVAETRKAVVVAEVWSAGQ